MKRFKGTVKNNVAVLEEGVHLPDGTQVEIRLSPGRRNDEEAFRRLLRNPITRPAGIDEVIEEDKSVREPFFPRKNTRCRAGRRSPTRPSARQSRAKN